MSEPIIDPPFPCCNVAGRPKASEVEARLHNLVHTAGKLFLQHGYRKVSLELIAREAHVAVRTIYVKFGGKAGLLKAALVANRDRFFNITDMETDTRPFRRIVDDFAEHFFDLVSLPEAISMQRMVIADAPSNPELAQTFFDAGPRQTREMLLRFFARPDIRAQLRDDVEIETLPMYLLTCVAGDQMARLLFEAGPAEREADRRALHARLALFYRGVLREA